jgi:nicotinamide mononucleotide (NMN) deamidase PncC
LNVTVLAVLEWLTAVSSFVALTLAGGVVLLFFYRGGVGGTGGGGGEGGEGGEGREGGGESPTE